MSGPSQHFQAYQRDIWLSYAKQNGAAAARQRLDEVVRSVRRPKQVWAGIAALSLAGAIGIGIQKSATKATPVALIAAGAALAARNLHRTQRDLESLRAYPPYAEPVDRSAECPYKIETPAASPGSTPAP